MNFVDELKRTPPMRRPRATPVSILKDRGAATAYGRSFSYRFAFPDPYIEAPGRILRISLSGVTKLKRNADGQG